MRVPLLWPVVIAACVISGCAGRRSQDAPDMAAATGLVSGGSGRRHSDDRAGWAKCSASDYAYLPSGRGWDRSRWRSLIIRARRPPIAAVTCARPAATPACTLTSCSTVDIVAMPMRRGYADSGNGWAANPGSCASPVYVQSAVEGGRDIDAVIGWITGSRDARPNRAIVVGEDEGGWAALGYASAYTNTPNPRVTRKSSMSVARWAPAPHRRRGIFAAPTC